MRIRSALALLLVAAFAAAPCWGAWYQDYASAKKEIERRRWQAAAAYLEKAIEGKPDSELGARTTGMFREDYLPHFYLGMCHLRLGNLERAEAEFRKEERAGAVSGRPDLAAQMRGFLEEIERKRGPVAPAPEPKPQPPPPPIPPPVVPEPEPKPKPKPSPVEPEPEPKPKPRPSPPSPQPTPTPAPAPTRGFDEATREEILRGLRLAEQGFYENAAQAIGTTAGNPDEDPRVAALLRAYSGSFFYTAYLLSRPQNRGLLDRARDAFVEALRLDPELTLPETYFSPRVISYFEGIRSARP